MRENSTGTIGGSEGKTDPSEANINQDVQGIKDHIPKGGGEGSIMEGSQLWILLLYFTRSARGATAAHQAPHKDTSRAKDVQVPVQHAERLFSRPPTVRVLVILKILHDHTQSTAQSRCSGQFLVKMLHSPNRSQCS